ncbi:hypothetical protein LCGC14_2946690 [marine sediment metagenome]|uniref:Uncharacterized protein n=1 Tax=marine sediment metagenome TaxID=412755 RepID=A0A0F9A7M7_9ZZZZ
MTAERQAWERMEGESVKAFSVFTSYLHMLDGERSYRNLAKMYNKSNSYVTQLSRWASKFEWQARLAAWLENQTKNIDEIRTDAQAEIIAAEFADYHDLRAQWLEQSKYIHPVERKTSTGKHGEVVILATDAYGFKAHIEARKRISEGLRLAAEMPSKIERNEETGKGGKDIIDYEAIVRALKERDSNSD